MIITENFFFDYLNSMNLQHLKNILGFKRLKTNKKVISFYLFSIFLHYKQQKSFKYIYRHYFSKNHNIQYSAFMHSIKNYSILMEKIFYFICKKIKIHKTIVNTVDTTLIAEKQEAFINSKDWKIHKVTTRKKQHICGSKGLFFINNNQQIYHAQLLNINESDQNILKNSAQYHDKLGKVLLADRGFNNKLTKQRLKTFNCTLISPNHYKKVEKTNIYFDKPWYTHYYKRRWKIEVLFKKLKDNYSDFKLNLTGKYTNELKKAKFFLSIIDYNLSTTI